MAKSTHPITYHYDLDGHDIAITRRHVGTAYARNGNVHNPTEYFVWDVAIDGKYWTSQWHDRPEAYEHARAHVLGIRYVYNERKHLYVNVRPYTVVQDEMKANYRRREVVKS